MPVPSELLSCPPLPLPPADDALTRWSQGDWAGYTNRLYDAGNNCRGQLQAIEAWQAGNGPPP